MLDAGSFFFALGNGAAEAVINPVVASMYPHEKTKRLNILHGGWPAGIALAGVLGIGMIHLGVDWRIMMSLILVPALIYGVIVFLEELPVNELVNACVSYSDILC